MEESFIIEMKHHTNIDTPVENRKKELNYRHIGNYFTANKVN